MVSNSFFHLIDQWPAPIMLTHVAGDVFLTIHQEPGFIDAKWTGHITSDDVIKAAQLSIPLFQATHCPALLNDKSEVNGDWFEANDWLEYEWMPQVIKAGLKYFAHVYSRNMLDHYSYRDFKRRVPPALQMRAFHSRTAAIAWLDHKIGTNNTARESPTDPSAFPGYV